MNGGTIYRDVRYAEFMTVVELDGSMFHNSARTRDADFERDLAAAAESGDCTLRLTYGQVFGQACTTAARVAAVLRRRGWRGELTRCPGCQAES